MPNPNHRFLVVIFMLCVVRVAHGATCDAGYYLNNGECTICPSTKYCPGNDIAVNCPDAVGYMRTTFPEKYRNPIIIRTYILSDKGGKDIKSCRAYTDMKSEVGILYEYAYYNPDTELYDIPHNIFWGYGWHTVNAGYYLTTPGACGVYAYYLDALECPAGHYCPGKAAVACNKENQATVHTTTFGLETCPAGYYCPAGAVKPTPCPVGTYSTTIGATDDSVCMPCTGATYSDTTGATACTPCPTATLLAGRVTGYGYHAPNGAPHSSMDLCFVSLIADDEHGNYALSCYLCDGDYGVSDACPTACQASQITCGGGYYVKNWTFNGLVWRSSFEQMRQSTCVPVDAGYWSADGDVERAACPVGLTTIGYGTGADEATDCGRALHIGDSTINLRSKKKTTPSLNVRIGDQIFYGNMATTQYGTLHINVNGTKYSVYDDSM